MLRIFLHHHLLLLHLHLYPFDGQSDSNIPMVEGEQFYVTEDDQDGWIRVRRVDGRFIPDEQLVEGFVPTGFLKFLA